MANKERLLVMLKELNLLVSSTNKQLEAQRLLCDSAALASNGELADKHRLQMHIILDLSLDQTAEQQRLIRLITLAGNQNE